MTVVALPSSTTGRRIADADELVQLLGIPFSAEQLAAITAPLEPGVIIAGAGTGKTSVMAARVVWLVGSGQVQPEQVLGLTFTRKAAAELSSRVRTALLSAGVIDTDGVDEAGEQVIMTYDAFAARLVSEHGLRIGVESDPIMITGATRYRLAARVVSAAAGPFESISRLRPASVTERVLKLDGELTQHLASQTELDRHARDFAMALRQAPVNQRGNPYAEVKKAITATTERLELASLAADYADLKRRLGVVEFADQMAVAARLAREVPQVSRSVRDSFSVVLLDEYQDTSAAQALMLQELFSGPDPESGRGHPVTAVGDPFQAIYGWRGAAASNILQFARDFPRADGSRARRFALTVNRRSGHTILTAANRISAPLRAAVDQAGRNGGTDGSSAAKLRPPVDAPAGSVQVGSFSTWPEEVEWIADRIAALEPERPRPGRLGAQPVARSGPVSSWAEVAVLTRRNADIGPLYVELTRRDIAVEIVGLGGLLTLPEVQDVVCTLRVLHDVTANPDLVRLLTGPRWAIGPRDLALLGRRAVELADRRDLAPRHASARPDGVLEALSAAVAQVDPTDMICLVDAVADPGDHDYSVAARQRLARVAGELASLRSHCDEPVLDLTRRVIATLGLETELIAAGPGASSTAGAPGGSRDQLAAFVDAVADYVDVDGDASLGGLLAWLQAEIDQGAGLDQAVPSGRDAVKLLTVHRAKGLEWEVVFLPSLTKGTFPSDRVTDDFVSNPAVLPAELRGDAGSIPQLADATAAAMKSYHAELAAEQLQAEHRLAYVAVTRAKRLLIGTGHHWRAETARARELSQYLTTLWAQAEATGAVLAEAPPAGPDNPLVTDAPARPWPTLLDPDALARRREAAGWVAQARNLARATGRYDVDNPEPLLLDHEQIVAGWDAEADRLIEEARRSRRRVRPVPVPPVLSATQVLRATADPDGFAAELARPMPRRPSASALLGTRFHRWVEEFYGIAQLVDPDDLPDRADSELVDGEDLYTLCTAFAAGQLAGSSPMAVETPFELFVGGQVLRGRIDAVFPPAGDDGRYLVVDWKTGTGETADPLQLALYRMAWATLHDVPLDRVDAAFYWVRSDRLERLADLPDLAGIERLLHALGEDPASTDLR